MPPSASKTERLTVAVPAGFDPERHGDAVLKKVTDAKGTGFAIESYNPTSGQVTLVRQSSIMQVSNAADDSFDVSLPRSAKPSDGDRLADRLADQHPGYQMTRFEPFLGRATLTAMSDDEVRCRGAVSTAIGCKPWEVAVSQTPDGGFAIDLPKKYMPSKHESKLDEVATDVVGEEGWYVSVDAKALTARIIPSEPPTFPAALPWDMRRLRKSDPDHTPFGRHLPEPGSEEGVEAVVDWTAAAHFLLGGVPQSGKSVLLNRLISDQLAAGAELVIITDASKSVDFLWCKEYVRDGGWGCDSLAGAVGALGLAYDEGRRRAKILAAAGVTTWYDLPESERFSPITIVVDELSALAVMDPEPKGVPKDHPLRLEVVERNLSKAMISSLINKIVAEQRFVGVRVGLSTQATNANTGVPPSLRMKIGHIMLQGTKASKTARSQIFTIDETQVPHVPRNVAEGGPAGRGAGVATLEGSAPFIYKTYFASVADYSKALAELNLRVTSRPAPTSAEIDRHLPTLDDGDDLDRQPKHDVERAPSGRPAREVFREMGDTWDENEDGSVVTGFAKANLARHQAKTGAAGRE